MAIADTSLPGRASDAGPESMPLDFTELLIEIESEAEYARKNDIGSTQLIRNRQRNSLYEIIRKANLALEMLP